IFLARKIREFHFLLVLILQGKVRRLLADGDAHFASSRCAGSASILPNPIDPSQIEPPSRRRRVRSHRSVSFWTALGLTASLRSSPAVHFRKEPPMAAEPRRAPMMSLQELVEKYKSLAGEFGKSAPLSAFALTRPETEALFSGYDEDYHISRF